MQQFTKTNPLHVHKIFWSSKKTYDDMKFQKEKRFLTLKPLD